MKKVKKEIKLKGMESLLMASEKPSKCCVLEDRRYFSFKI
jgi:hypothetical protein